MPNEAFREYNAVLKDFSKIDIAFGLCYPSTYRSGMTGLAIHLFYSALNNRDDTSCERYFRYDTKSPANSVESGRPLRDNHIVGFSLTYEENIIELVQMLEKGGIPVGQSERTDDDPIVLVGGPVVSANPEPYVDFIDAFVIGEGDIVIHKIVDVVGNAESRRDAIESLAEIEGVYVPSIPQNKIVRLIMKDFDSLFHPTAQVVADVEEGSKLESVFGQSLLVEVSRGCGHSCKFCLVGHICRPRRTRSISKLKAIIEKGVQETPVKKVSLIASSLGDLDNLEELASWVIDQDLQLSTPSVRADRVTPNLLKIMKKAGQRTLTIAPETGSSRLRKEMGKGLDDEGIFSAVRYAHEADIGSLKTYFIIGLPGETEEDVLAIGKMVKKLALETGMRITVNVNPFIPKAHTRWEREAQPTLEVLRSKIKIIQQSLHNVPRVRIETLDPRNARVQAALSVGDRSIGRVIRVAASYGGLSGWRRAERETGVRFFEIANDSSRKSEPLPWKSIE
ncbi:MAG: radical SAM protein [Candidatus Thorarchaeota archaeon]|nr:radical SAM protein [Candidatus Thorarchaeota archaeon]